MFGRMVTSDPDANTDAAVHVAHAFTVHKEEAETDYFTVVDDLERGTGAGGIFDTEINAGLFYLYVVIDMPVLLANLAGDVPLAGKVIEHLAHLIATVSPGAKKGSTAPYAYADFVLAEAGSRQPRSLANAFRDAVKPPSVAAATAALGSHLAALDAMYGARESAVCLGAQRRARLARHAVARPPRYIGARHRRRGDRRLRWRVI